MATPPKPNRRPRGLPSPRALKAFELVRSGLTAAEVAVKFGIARQTANKLIQEGREGAWTDQ